ncbi:MAG: PolC-type DNA polymerase III [Acutalibacteraceae bacterium]|nr:PolC-type DNA polymerase III [Acutalibacteraceae bacterium]
MSVKFSAVFEPFLNRRTSVFGNCDMIKCDLDMEKRSLDIELLSEKYIKKEVKDELITLLKTALKTSVLNLQLKFTSSAFSPVACEDICQQLRYENVMLNGYFNSAQYILNGSELDIVLAFGGLKIIEETGFEQKFINTVKNTFGVDISVKFSGQTENIEMTLPEEAPPVDEEIPLPEEAPEEAAPQPQKITVTTGALPEFLYDIELFYGKKLEENFTRLIDIIPFDTGKIQLAGWGEVFNYEVKDINTKRGPRKIVTFCLSDKTNSIYCKMFMTDEDMPSIKPVKDGAVIVFNGSYSLDAFSGKYILEPKAMATAKMTEETDDYPEKRVELHCHTNMSQKDAVSPAGVLIDRAYKWGHKAIAITDHGVVQSYPAVAEAVGKIRKNGGEFKAIYGVEDYFADDTKGETDISKLRSYHQIILVKDLVGLKNLYQLVSKAHVEDFHKRPVTRRSEIEKHREGLIIGSACEAGELFDAVLNGKSDEELIEIAKFYDYLEIQPLGNNEFMIRDSIKPDKVSKKGVVTPNPYKHVKDIEVLKNFNRKIVEIADKLSLPVVATGDVHFATKEDEILRKVLMAAQGYEDFDNQAPLYLKTTTEMMEDFSYFGDRAKEFVIDNPNKIADMVSADVVPVPPGNYPPVIEGSDDLLRNLCWDRAMKMYGYKGEITDIVKKRLDKELNSIINNGFSIMYISAQKLVKYSEDNGYLVGSRGSVGSSFAATMAGISEVNPLPPHYYCPNCQWNEFFRSDVVGSGFDLPEKNCPHCDTPLNRDGHDIPFETFLGFKGDKVPDIDLNFSDEFQNDVQKYTETLFGKENVFKAGTITTIAEKTAFGYVKAYCEKKGIVLSQAEMERLAKIVENSKIKATSGQHPAGMIVVPADMTIYDFCPIQHPADDPKSDILTTHFDFHSIHDNILKLDELGHVVPTTYKYLEEYTGISVNDISMSDPAVYSLFTTTEALGVTPQQIESDTGTFCIPEFGTAFVRGMLMDCKPKNFADLLQISGLSHGTDVWLGNAKDLIDQGICTISNVIGTRDNIMVYLINQGMDEGRAFKITETVRKGLVAKGKVSKEDWEQMEEDMRKVNVPEWYIGSCKKIKYMFPKAHAAAYVISALRLCWYKVHKPLEFYCAYFTARPGDVDAPILMQGHEAVKRYIRETKAKGKEASKKELDVLDNMYIFNEMLHRGLKILPIDLKKSHAVKFVPEKEGMRLPFGSVSGMGDKAAFDVYNAAQQGDFLSVEDFQAVSGVSKAVVQSLADLGVFGDLPDTNQMSMF